MIISFLVVVKVNKKRREGKWSQEGGKYRGRKEGRKEGRNEGGREGGGVVIVQEGRKEERRS